MTISVLLVDDDLVVRAVLREAFDREADFSVIAEAATVIEALALARAEEPAVVVLDHHLPGDGFSRLPMQGMELVEYLDSMSPKPVVVLHSSDDRMRDTALRTGVDAFVLKGPGSTALPDTIRRLIAERR